MKAQFTTIKRWGVMCLGFVALAASAGEAERQVARQLKGAAFTAYPQSEVTGSFVAFQNAFSQMDAILRRQPKEVDEGWREHLNIPLLAQVAAGKQVSAYDLDQNLWWYFRNKAGLELPYMIAVRETGTRYSEALKFSAIPQADLQKSFEDKKSHLSALLEVAAVTPEKADYLEIGRLIGWMEKAHQLQGWLPTIRATFERPNFQFTLSSKLLLNAFQPQNINRAEPVTDNFKGTAIFGNTVFNGSTQAVLTPNAAQGNIDVVLTGTANTSSNGYQRGATITSASTTSVVTTARLLIHPRGFTLMPAVTNAHTSSQILGASYQPDRDFLFPRIEQAVKRIGSRVAMKEAQKSKGEAEQYASQRAANRFSPELDKEVTERIGKRLEEVNKLYNDNFYLAFFRHDIFPKQMGFATASTRIAGAGTVVRDNQFGNVEKAPPLPPESDATFQLHESALNNFIEAAYGWFVASDTYVEEFAKTIYGSLPQELWVYKGSERWKLEMERLSPGLIRIGDDKLSVTLNIEKFVRTATKEWLPVSVTGVYRLTKDKNTPGKFLFTREGEVTLNYGKNPALDAKGEDSLKAFASPKLLALFPEAPTFPNLMLPEGIQESNLPALENTSLNITRGWISGSWKVVPKAPKVEKKTP